MQNFPDKDRTYAPCSRIAVLTTGPPGKSRTIYSFSFFCDFMCLFFWPCWVFVAVCGLSLVAAIGLLLAVAFLVAARGLSSTSSAAIVHRLSCKWDLPGSGIEPVSPALAGHQENPHHFLFVMLLRLFPFTVSVNTPHKGRSLPIFVQVRVQWQLKAGSV